MSHLYSFQTVFFFGMICVCCIPNNEKPRQAAGPITPKTESASPKSAAQKKEQTVQESVTETVPATAQQTSEKVLMGGHWVTLEERQGKCIVRSEDNQVVTTEVPTPCAFSRTADGKVRVESPHGYPIILVESSKPKPHPELKNMCDTVLQPLRMKDSVLEASAHTSRILMCAPNVWDLKHFSAAFE